MGPPLQNPSSISTMSPITWPAESSVPYYVQFLRLGAKRNFTDWGFPIYAPSTFAPGSVSRRQRDLSPTACQECASGGFGPGQQFPGISYPRLALAPIAAAYLAFIPTPTNSLGNQQLHVVAARTGYTHRKQQLLYGPLLDHNYGYSSDHFYFSYWRQYTSPNLATTLPR